MADLRQTERKIRIALIAMLCLDVVAVGVLVSPLVGSAISRREQMAQLWAELQQKTRTVEPLLTIDKKVDLAGQQIGEFYRERLPARDSQIFDRLGKVASENGVKILQAKSKLEDPEPIGLQPVTIDADLSGDYLQLVKFVNALEREQTFFTVQSVTLAGESNGPVKLAVKVQTFLRAESGPAERAGGTGKS